MNRYFVIHLVILGGPEIFDPETIAHTYFDISVIFILNDGSI